LNPKPQFTLKAHTTNILYPLAKTIVTPKIEKALSIVNMDKPLDVDLDITGPLKGGEPLIHVLWKTKNNQLATPFIDFQNASFSGTYTNEVVAGLPRKDPNSQITIKDFTATWHGLPITSNNIAVTNLLSPLLVCDLRSQFPLQKLNEAFEQSYHSAKFRKWYVEYFLQRAGG
jgi:hypothetical protein